MGKHKSLTSSQEVTPGANEPGGTGSPVESRPAGPRVAELTRGRGYGFGQARNVTAACPVARVPPRPKVTVPVRV